MRIYPLIVILTLVSCKESKTLPEKIDFSNTEEIQEQKATSDVISFSRRKSQDIVEHLYNEALTSDPMLKELDENINHMNKMRLDSLSDINEFLSYNSMYYSAVHSYINSISDSSKRKEIEVFMLKSSHEYQQITRPHDKKRSDLASLEKELNDQHTLMKVMVSENFMRLYQKNIPTLRTIENLSHEYTKLINESKKYTNFGK